MLKVPISLKDMEFWSNIGYISLIWNQMGRKHQHFIEKCEQVPDAVFIDQWKRMSNVKISLICIQINEI